jgi:tRNA(fMet)-specific endonuclease VapC
VAWHELTYGAERMDEGRRHAYLVEYLHEVIRSSMPVLPHHTTAAQWHGWARATLKKKGFSTPYANGQIAAIAATENLVVVKQNVSDLEPFATLEDGIRLGNWLSG